MAIIFVLIPRDQYKNDGVNTETLVLCGILTYIFRKVCTIIVLIFRICRVPYKNLNTVFVVTYNLLYVLIDGLDVLVFSVIDYHA